MTSASDKPLGPRPASFVIAAFVLSLTGLCFAVAAAVLIYASGLQVNAPPVAQSFAAVAAVLLAIAVVHFVAAGGIWSGRAWAALLGIVVSFVVTAIAGYVGLDQLTHSEDALRVSAPYLATAFLYAVCLIGLLTNLGSFKKT